MLLENPLNPGQVPIPNLVFPVQVHMNINRIKDEMVGFYLPLPPLPEEVPPPLPEEEEEKPPARYFHFLFHFHHTAGFAIRE